LRKSVWLVAAAGVALALALGGLLSPLASSAPDGLERVAEQTGFAQAERETPLAGASPLADYSVPGVRAEATSTALAGALGTVMAFLAGIAATVALRALWRKRVPGVERRRVRG